MLLVVVQEDFDEWTYNASVCPVCGSITHGLMGQSVSASGQARLAILKCPISKSNFAPVVLQYGSARPVRSQTTVGRSKITQGRAEQVVP